MRSIRFRLTSSVIALIVLLLANISIGLYGTYKSGRSMNALYSDRIVPLRDLKIVADKYAVNIVDTSHKINNGNIAWAEGAPIVADAQTSIGTIWASYLATDLSEAEKHLVADTRKAMVAADAAVKELSGILAGATRHSWRASCAIGSTRPSTPSAPPSRP